MTRRATIPLPTPAPAPTAPVQLADAIAPPDLRPLTVPEPAAAKMLGVSDRTLQRLVAAGKLRRIKIGRSTRYRVRDLEAYINSL